MPMFYSSLIDTTPKEAKDLRRKSWWLAGGALVLGASQSLVTYAFEQLACAKRKTNSECLHAQEEIGLLRREDLKNLLRRRVEAKSVDGLKLSGWLLPGREPVQRVIVMVHGYTATSSWMLHLALPFLSRGWTVLLIDQRSHGASEGQYASYGYWEKFDLDRWMDWVTQEYGAQAIVGLFGQSMGGATVLEYAAINRRASFIIADCAYSDMRQLIAYQIGSIHHLPVRPLLQLVDRRLKHKVGFQMSDVSPVRALKSRPEVPVMFIHGGKDTFVPTEMSVDMFEQNPGRNKLLVIPEAGHVQSYATDRHTYELELFRFIANALGEKEGNSMAFLT